MLGPERQSLSLVWGVALLWQTAIGVAVAEPKEEEFLLRLRDGVYGCLPGRVTEEELLDYYAAKAAEQGLAPDKRVHYVRTYLDLLLNFDPSGARQNMPSAYSVLGVKSPQSLTLSENWEWAGDKDGGELVHTSADGTPHSASGVSRYIIPTGAVFAQKVSLDPEQPPREISVGFTVPRSGYGGHFKNHTCRVRWGGKPARCRTDNTPHDFHVGPLPQAGKWLTLEVPALNIGLGGVRPLFFGISFQSVGGKARWGQTVFRRAALELLSKPLGIYHWGEPLDMSARVNNHGELSLPGQLTWEAYDLDGNRVYSGSTQTVVPAGSQATSRLEIPEAAYVEKIGLLRRKNRPLKSYFTVHATLSGAGVTAKARTSFGFILPNRTGRDPESPFGTMLWDTPASKRGAELYRDAGTKLFSINPGRVRDGEGPLLSLYSAHDMFLHARIWELAFVSAKDARAYEGDQNPLIPKLSQQVSLLRPKGARFISNFWEVDLRNLPETYGLNAKYFRDAARHGNPEALVGTGGLAGTNVAYVERMMGNGGAGNLDFVTFMGYFTPSPPERSGLFEEVKALQGIFRRHGVPNTQLWCAEWNVFDHLNIERPELDAQWIHSGVSRDLVSQYIVREALTLLAAGVTKVLPNALFQFARRPLSQTYGHTMTGCSSHRHDYSPLPMYFAWSVLTRHLEGKRLRGLIDCGPGVYCARFDNFKDSWKELGSSASVIALWSEFGTKSIGLELGQNAVDVVSFVGDVRTFHPTDGKLSLAATPRPKYVLLRSSPGVAKATSPIIIPLEDQHEAIAGEDALISAGFRIANPNDKRMRGSLKFDGPDWCVADPTQVVVDLPPRQNRIIDFRIQASGKNHDRTHYEFADLTRRAEHTIAVRLVDRRGRLNAETRVPLVVHEPLEVRLRPLLKKRGDQERPELLVLIRNRGSEVKKGVVEIRTKAALEISPSKTSFLVRPGSEVTARFGVRGGPIRGGASEPPESSRVRLSDYKPEEGGYYRSFGIGEGYVVEAVVKCDEVSGGDENRQSRGFSFFPCTRAARPPAIDGQDAEWRDAAWFDVQPESRINGLPFFCNVHSHHKENVGMYFGGPSDLSARWAAMWDDSHLYLFFRVFDDTFHQPNTNSLLWNGDSVCFTVDPTPEQTDAGIHPRPRDPASFHTFDAGLSPDGPQLYRRYHACGSRPGLVNAARTQARKLKDGAAYELAIPWSELGSFKPSGGGWLQLSIVFNDSDGHGRKTWINWFGGLGGLAREPRLMGDLNLVE